MRFDLVGVGRTSHSYTPIGSRRAHTRLVVRYDGSFCGGAREESVHLHQLNGVRSSEIYAACRVWGRRDGHSTIGKESMFFEPFNQDMSGFCK